MCQNCLSRQCTAPFQTPRGGTVIYIVIYMKKEGAFNGLILYNRCEPNMNQ